VTVRIGEIAYCAGVVDSDGTIGVHVNWYAVRRANPDSKQPTYQPRVTVKQVERGAVDVLHGLFGGSLSIDGRRDGRARPLYRWGVSCAAARPVLAGLLPHLRIKARQAELALELCDLNARPRRLTFDVPEVAPDEEVVALADAAALAGKSYASAQQSVKLGNIPVVRRGRRVFVPTSYIETWRSRGRSPGRPTWASERMAEIKAEITTLNQVGV
jgi:hypothetical protein